MERLSAEMACYINVPVTTDSCASAEDTKDIILVSQLSKSVMRTELK